MPNAISCAYFALKNHEIAKKDNNVFREGIAGIQAVRTVDAAATAIAALPAASVLALGGKTAKATAPAGATFGSTWPPVCHKAGKIISKAAKVGRKLVYPLIVLSGVFNTVKSDDKVKTGFSQASGIGTMYLAETVAEKILVPLTKKVDNLAANKPVLKGAWAVARGALYVAASLGGYKLGNRIVGSTIDSIRQKKKDKAIHKLEIINNTPATIQENQVFSSIQLD